MAFGVPYSERRITCSAIQHGTMAMKTNTQGTMQNTTEDRRRAPRVQISQSIRISPADPRFQAEVATTLNVSRYGLYFVTSKPYYFAGMDVHLIRNFRPGDPMNRQEQADVVRVERSENGTFGVAIRILRVEPRSAW